MRSGHFTVCCAPQRASAMDPLPPRRESSPADSTTYEDLFVSQLRLVERIVASICRRQRLRAEDGEDLASFVRLRLIENDYAVFRKFQRRSSLSTYLTTVIQRFCLDFQTARWGK